MASTSVDVVPPSQLLHYLPTYQVLICLRCRYAIQPGAVVRHLKEIHYVHRSARQAFVEYASEFELAQPNDVVLPDEAQFPVPLLPVQDGIACCFEGCAHLCATTKRMKQHWRLVHRTSASDGGSFWKPAPLQTFFRGNAFRYFTNPALLVPSPASASDSSDGLTSDGFPSTTVTTPAVREARMESSLSTWDPHQSLIRSDEGLLDHYRAYTYKTLSCNPETEDAFGVIVLELASRFPFLLHGVLACSALHLASTDPGNRTYYTIQSMRHQDQAIPAFRRATMHVDSDNCEAVLAFAFFLVICALSSGSEDSRFFLSDDNDQLHWISILRNGWSMLCPVWTELTGGPLAPFAALWRDDLGVTADANDPLLVTLLHVFPEHEPEYPIYRDSAVKLTEAFAFIQQRGPSSTIWDALNSWPMRVMPEYLALLKQNRPGALLLLAYYAILLRPIRGEWFLEGRDWKLIDEIARRLQGNCSPQIWDLFAEIQQEYFF
ncbi:uncharacterized protein ACLA_082690 [Aspergillus clavatus NRRL 1]|uniref:C2H2-type domain-containing protein n=1 Tax=Aspergillus clavatus (strain ATCC 1007 / CBS 513.65 / DSM 816 / NCTC 3887 / NRRL 1 / QM 1276 / 107) TaxID=344612 RepID=A1CTE1_ASPCL|nr:uncharacterized protein ACLA_082690 [Aspergillus clavatus NRRL 1]EAW06578.1 hypothetical protein ACLA_082690 [Aspergillus clavatus NRRL 1]